MAISFNTGATASANTASSVSITIPSGVLTNDVMIMSLEVFTESSSTPTISFSGAGGSWTLVPVSTGSNPEQSSGGSIFQYGYAYYRVATAGDPGASLTITESGSAAGTTWFAVTINAYTGASTSSPIDVAGSASTTGATNTIAITLPSKTTGVANDWAVYLLQAGLIPGASETISSGTIREHLTSSAGVAAASADSNGSVGGSGTSIGGNTWNITGQGASNTWLTAFTIGLAPPAAGGASGTVQSLATLPALRRKPARAVVSFVAVKTTNLLNGTVQPRPTLTPPRRKPARAVVNFVPVQTFNTGHGPAGTVQPVATVPVPRRRPARAVVQFVPVRTVNQTGINGQVQPAGVPAVMPRRRPGRAVVQFVPVVTVNTGHGPAGKIQPLATFPTPRRRPSRGQSGFIPVTTVNTGHGPAGTVQPRGVPGVMPRRKPSRGGSGFVPVTTVNNLVPVIVPGSGAVERHHRRGRGR